MASDDALADELRSLARTLHETVADDERRAAALDLLREANAARHRRTAPSLVRGRDRW